MPRSIGDCDDGEVVADCVNDAGLTEDAPLNRGLRLPDHVNEMGYCVVVLTEDAPLNRGLRLGLCEFKHLKEVLLTEDAPLNRGLRQIVAVVDNQVRESTYRGCPAQ